MLPADPVFAGLPHRFDRRKRREWDYPSNADGLDPNRGSDRWCDGDLAALHQPVGDGFFRFGADLAVKRTGIGQGTRVDKGFAQGFSLSVIWGENHLLDGDIVGGGKGKIAGIVGGHRHHRAGSVVGQDKVGNVDWHRLTVGGVDRIGTGENAFLFGGIAGAFFGALVGASSARKASTAARCSSGRNLINQRVLWRQGHEGDTEEGIRTGGKDGDFGVAALHR